MTEIEQLRKDIATMEAAMPIATRLKADVSYHNLKGLKRELQDQLAKLEAEAAAKDDPWANAKWQAKNLGNDGRPDIYNYANRLEHRIAELEAELARRPVVYCLRNKATGKYNKFAIHAGVALYDRNDFATFDQWEFEPYTGQQS